MSFIPLGFDENNIIRFSYNEDEIYNPFEIALQSMIGEQVFEPYRVITGSLVPRYYPLRYIPDPTNDSYAIAAMEWISRNETGDRKSGFWEYHYSGEYAGVNVRAPWRCSFGQAYIALAALLWYIHTKKKEYHDMALRALNGLATPVEKGGLAFTLPQGLWFEEIPSSNPTHIFNAHLLSLLAFLEGYDILHEETLLPWIEKGLNAFLSLCHLMDTGTCSAYDIPPSIDIMIQLVPVDPGRKIKVRRIGIMTSDGERVIQAGYHESFTPGKEWIAGIEWGATDSEGYREILHGPSVHPVSPHGGDRQNTYAYFKDVVTREDFISLFVEYFAEYESELHLFRIIGDRMVPLGFTHTMKTFPGANTGTITIPRSAFFLPVSEYYHFFHLLLLEEITRFRSLPQLHSLIMRFRSYSSGFVENYPHENRSVKLDTLYVSVNRTCGLSCKMCDFGSRNEEASLYRNFVPPGDKKDLDPDIFISRCRELEGTLRFVHFIGVEPTLYSHLPFVITELKKAGIRVAITTNGINLKKSLPHLLASGLDEVWISLDGPSHIHDEIRGKEGLFNDICRVISGNLEEIQKRKEGGFILGAGYVVTPLNYSFLSEFMEETSSIPFDWLIFTHLNYITPEIAEAHNIRYPEYPIGPSCTHKEMDPLLVNPFLLWRSMIKAQELSRKMNRKIAIVPGMEHFITIEDFYKRPHIPVGASRCEVPFLSLEINSDGSICVMSRCYQFPIGNIYEQSLKDIFYKGIPLYYFRKSLTENKLWEPCLRCCAILK